jgi:choline dehydrogenase
MSTPDYIVVGAGSAGCALAARLSEDPQISVLLVEAGGPDTDELIRAPAAWPAMWGTAVDWAYETTPQARSAGQVHQWPRGKVLGGSSSLNGMVYLRGNPVDWDAWAYQGCSGWDYESLLPLMRGMEDVPGGDPRFRGVGGPLSPRPVARPNPISAAFVDAAAERGYAISDDLNGEVFEAAGYHDLLIKDGERESAASGYLRPLTERPNLTVSLHTTTRRLLIEDGLCVGVQVERDGAVEELRAKREVVLSAGTIGSPELLLRSGIGPAQELLDLGIEPVADVPGVGQNLHDHLLMGVLWEAAQPVPAPEYNLAESSMFLRSDAALKVPDLHFMCIHVPFHLPTFAPPVGSWTIAVGLVRPASRGSLRLTSADPTIRPSIDPGYLTAEADLEALVKGIKLARELADAPAFDDWRGPEALPGEQVQSDEELREYVRHAAGTYYHPVGTCRMGVGTDAVVDPELRVRGVRGLRVADASIMPDIVSANTNTTAILIGEKAAELIRTGRRQPAVAADAIAGI